MTNKDPQKKTRTPLKTGCELRCFGRVSSSCSTGDIRRVNLVTNPVICHEWGKDREVFTYLLAFNEYELKSAPSAINRHGQDHAVGRFTSTHEKMSITVNVKLPFRFTSFGKMKSI